MHAGEAASGLSVQALQHAVLARQLQRLECSSTPDLLAAVAALRAQASSFYRAAAAPAPAGPARAARQKCGRQGSADAAQTIAAWRAEERAALGAHLRQVLPAATDLQDLHVGTFTRLVAIERLRTGLLEVLRAAGLGEAAAAAVEKYVQRLAADEEQASFTYTIGYCDVYDSASAGDVAGALVKLWEMLKDVLSRARRGVM